MNLSRYREVHSPARTDGVGVALRRAFNPSQASDEDFKDLLRELDGKTS
ncbi:MAG: hypothetical protein ABW048_01750 [Sphingobium sp.]